MWPYMLGNKRDPPLLISDLFYHYKEESSTAGLTPALKICLMPLNFHKCSLAEPVCANKGNYDFFPFHTDCDTDP